jgi:hypothetical protein
MRLAGRHDRRSLSVAERVDAAPGRASDNRSLRKHCLDQGAHGKVLALVKTDDLGVVAPGCRAALIGADAAVSNSMSRGRVSARFGRSPSLSTATGSEHRLKSRTTAPLAPASGDLRASSAAHHIRKSEDRWVNLPGRHRWASQAARSHTSRPGPPGGQERLSPP